jgi:hypothetical protein
MQVRARGRSGPSGKATFVIITAICAVVVVLLGVKILHKRPAPTTAVGAVSSHDAGKTVTVAAMVTGPHDAAKDVVKPVSAATPASPRKDAGKSVAPADEKADTIFIPSGPGAPTVVTFKNDGAGPMAVQYVEFEIIGDVFRTPKRSPLPGEGAAIPVVFQLDEARPQRVLRYDLPAAKQSASDKHWTALNLSIVDPRHSQWSYRGKVTVHYAGAPAVKVKQLVELDILGASPPPAVN